MSDVRTHANTAEGARELAELVDAPLSTSPDDLVRRVGTLLESGRVCWEHVHLGRSLAGMAAPPAATSLSDLAEPVVLAPEYAIVIELVGEDGSPVPGVDYEVAFPDGSVRSGSLDADGRAELSRLTDPGECRVCFPTLDRDAWEYIHAKPL